MRDMWKRVFQTRHFDQSSANTLTKVFHLSIVWPCFQIQTTIASPRKKKIQVCMNFFFRVLAIVVNSKSGKLPLLMSVPNSVEIKFPDLLLMLLTHTSIFFCCFCHLNVFVSFSFNSNNVVAFPPLFVFFSCPNSKVQTGMFASQTKFSLVDYPRIPGCVTLI